MRIGDIGEFGLIDRIAGLVGDAPGAVLTAIGDDTAVIDTGAPRLLLATIDMQIEDRHFIRARTSPADLGRRIAAVNLSDIGAMGGEPRWALASLALPADLEVEWVDQFYRGLTEQLGRFGATVIGGNLSGGTAIVLDLALLGEVERDAVLRREGACPGDLLLVTGDLGASAAGRQALDAGLDQSDPAVAAMVAAHHVPVPRVREGGAIAATRLATAMIDLSDGLSSDLGHLCERSGVGAAIDAAKLPVAAETRTIAARLGLDPVRLAIAGGEDLELLFSAPPEAAGAIDRAVQSLTGVPVTVIGRVMPAEHGRRILIDGRSTPLTADGWDHFRA